MSGKIKKSVSSRGGRFTVSGAGVLQIRSTEILKTARARNQIKALKNISIVKSTSLAK